MVVDTVPRLSKHGEVDEVVHVLAVFRLVCLRIRGARCVESNRSLPLCGQRAGLPRSQPAGQRYASLLVPEPKFKAEKAIRGRACDKPDRHASLRLATGDVGPIRPRAEPHFADLRLQNGSEYRTRPASFSNVSPAALRDVPQPRARGNSTIPVRLIPV